MDERPAHTGKAKVLWPFIVHCDASDDPLLNWGNGLNRVHGGGSGASAKGIL